MLLIYEGILTLPLIWILLLANPIQEITKKQIVSELVSEITFIKYNNNNFSGIYYNLSTALVPYISTEKCKVIRNPQAIWLRGFFIVQ